jgi:hypothetical protein
MQFRQHEEEKARRQTQQLEASSSEASLTCQYHFSLQEKQANGQVTSGYHRQMAFCEE